MNSTRRRWQTTGSRAPGATLGLRRRAAAMAPTNQATLCMRAPLCVSVLMCIMRCVWIVRDSECRSEKAWRKNTQDEEERREKKQIDRLNDERLYNV